MEQFSTEETETAKKLLDFYVDLVENHSPTIKYYLAEDVVVDWFGKTVKSNKKASIFIKEQISNVTHHITNTFPTDSVAFKDTHYVKLPKATSEDFLVISPLPTFNKDSVTPPKSIEPSTSSIEIGQGDGHHNPVIMSPPKKLKLAEPEEESETVEGEIEPMKLKYLTAEGSVEFHKASCKKLQSETRWKRPVKLHLGYTANSFKDCTIYLVIYEGNLKCRRNLFKEFYESDNSAKSST